MTRIASVNERAARMFGGDAARTDMIGRPISRFWPVEGYDLLADVLTSATDEPTRRIALARAGEIKGMLHGASLAAWRSPARKGDGDGVIYLMVNGAASADRSASDLHASEDRYRKLIHHMPTALWQVDARPVGEIFDRLKEEGVSDIAAFLDAHPELVDLASDLVRVTEANRHAAALFRSERAADLLGPVRYLFEASPDTGKRVMAAHFTGERVYMERSRIRTRDGELRDVQFSVTFPTPPEQLDTTFLILTDITEQLRTEALLQRLQSDHAHASRMSTLGELATSIAHEVKQPLAAIVTNGETSLRWLSRSPTNVVKVQQLTERMVASAQRASDIVHRIRQMVVNDDPQHGPIDIGAVVDEALLFVRHDIESKGIALSVAADAPALKTVGDRIQLQQVIVNLLVNSIQAVAAPGRPDRRIEVAYGADETRQQLSFSISDNGPGIPEEVLGRVFDSFFTTKRGGMGVGLAICQSIILAHGGEIAAENRPEGGARLQFRIPLRPQVAGV